MEKESCCHCRGAWAVHANTSSSTSPEHPQPLHPRPTPLPVTPCPVTVSAQAQSQGSPAAVPAPGGNQPAGTPPQGWPCCPGVVPMHQGHGQGVAMGPVAPCQLVGPGCQGSIIQWVASVQAASAARSSSSPCHPTPAYAFIFLKVIISTCLDAECSPPPHQEDPSTAPPSPPGCNVAAGTPTSYLPSWPRGCEWCRMPQQ